MSGAKKIVAKLKFKVCVKFESNYSNKWIVGADSVRTSNIKEHARTDQHAHVRTKWPVKIEFDRAKLDMTGHNDQPILKCYFWLWCDAKPDKLFPDV